MAEKVYYMNTTSVPSDATTVYFSVDATYGNLDLNSKGMTEDGITLSTYSGTSEHPTAPAGLDLPAEFGALKTRSRKISDTDNTYAPVTIAKDAYLIFTQVENGADGTSGGDGRLIVNGKLKATNGFNNNRYKNFRYVDGVGLTGHPSTLTVGATGEVTVTGGSVNNFGACTITVQADGENKGSFTSLSDIDVTNFGKINVFGKFTAKLLFKNGASADMCELTIKSGGIFTAGSLTNEKTNGNSLAATILVESGSKFTVTGDLTNSSVKATKTVDDQEVPYGGFTINGGASTESLVELTVGGTLKTSDNDTGFIVSGTNKMTIGQTTTKITVSNVTYTRYSDGDTGEGYYCWVNGSNYRYTKILELEKGSTVYSDPACEISAGTIASVNGLEGRIALADGVTLHASSITGKGSSGKLNAQGDLSFTGANTLKDITLTASADGKSVTVGQGASLTLKGTDKLTIGTLNGEIAFADGATLNASTISNSTFGAYTFTALGDMSFTGTNTLSNLTLNATADGKTVTVASNALLVKGTDKLNIGSLTGEIKTDSAAATTLTASDITGSAFAATNKITAQNALNFTGANSLKNITLNADSRAVTVGTDDGDSLTLKGTDTLKTNSLTGEIKTDSETVTFLTGTSVTGSAFAATNKITAQNALTFTGANVLKNITLDATDKTVTVGSATGDSLTVQGTDTLNIGELIGTITVASNVTLNASSITNSNRSGTLNATAGGVTFKGANTLKNITLNATDKTVVVGTDDGDSLTLKGSDTQFVGKLNGTIKTDTAATTLTDSNITGGGSNGGTITAQGDLSFAGASNALSSLTLNATAEGVSSVSFTGANTLNGVTLNATDKTINIGNTDETPDSLLLTNSSKLSACRGRSGGTPRWT